ncbi:MAG TPA: anti-sigma factor antagonist [Candidatus Limnocylindrales bacterium]|nr:anti-sigma factor antagonist [Candidatus Limnocylindrales bacterium]
MVPAASVQGLHAGTVRGGPLYLQLRNLPRAGFHSRDAAAFVIGSRLMQLTLQHHKTGNVTIIACKGRIVMGEETRSLQAEVEKLTLASKKVVLHLEGVNFIDSGGLGALVRMRGVLRANHGDLKLCALSPFVRQVIVATNLHGIFQPLATEQEAINSFSTHHESPSGSFSHSKMKILCVDSSSDLLAYLHALVDRLGFEGFTSRHVSDAMTMMKIRKPDLVIFGPGLHSNDFAIEKLRQNNPSIQLLQLDSDFSTVDATESGTKLAEQIRALLPSSQ